VTNSPTAREEADVGERLELGRGLDVRLLDLMLRPSRSVTKRTGFRLRALARAGQELVGIDPDYELVGCERRVGGWCLVGRTRGSSARSLAWPGAKSVTGR